MSMPASNLPLLEDPTAWGGRVFASPLPLDLATVQTAIVNKLAAAFAGTRIGVFGYPDKPTREWWKERQAIGYFLVSYKRSEFGKPLSTDSMVQERTAEWEIHALARQISWADFGATGVFQAMLQVGKNALTGFRAPGWRNGYFVSEEFLAQGAQGQIWDYAFKYRTITMEIKQPDTAVEAALALLKKVQYIETNGLTPVPVPASAYTFGGNGVLQLPSQNITAVIVTSITALQPYILGTDYTVQQAQGTITIVPGGALSPGQNVIVSFSASDVTTTNEQGGPVPFYPSN